MPGQDNSPKKKEEIKVETFSQNNTETLKNIEKAKEIQRKLREEEEK